MGRMARFPDRHAGAGIPVPVKEARNGGGSKGQAANSSSGCGGGRAGAMTGGSAGSPTPVR